MHAYRTQLRTIWLAGLASLALQALVVLYYLAIARGLGIPLPASAAFLMVPLCTLLQAVPISFNGWGLREGLFTVYFAQVGLPRESALAFSLVGAGLMVLLSLSGAVVWMARGGAPAEPHRPPEAHGRPRPPRLRQVRRPRVEHPRRLAPVLLVVPALRPRALRGLAVRPQAPGARHALARASRASRSATSAAAASTRASWATSSRLARERGARILHVHGYAAADFGRLAARAAGAKLVLHEHFADPRMPAYQALADRLLRPGPTARSR